LAEGGGNDSQGAVVRMGWWQ